MRVSERLVHVTLRAVENRVNHMTPSSPSKFKSADVDITSFIDERRRRAAEAFGEAEAVAVIASGEPIAKPGGLDQTYPFLPQPNYYWLTGSRRWGNVLTWERVSGWTHFVRPIDAAERLWEGTTEEVDGIDRKEFDDWLKVRSGRPLAVLGAGARQCDNRCATDRRAARAAGGGSPSQRPL